MFNISPFKAGNLFPFIGLTYIILFVVLKTKKLWIRIYFTSTWKEQERF